MSVQTPPDGKTKKTEPEQPPASESGWALRILTVSGIPIRLHFTFLLLVLWLAVTGLDMKAVAAIISVVGLFLCVALHELGHSLVAQRFGYPVRDITLYPIGGVAAIEGSPTPRHELFIAIAGPAVNVVIAAVLMVILGVMGKLPQAPEALRELGHDPLILLLQMNIMLAVFNLIPAFPMDGGRILRAFLGLRMGKAKATRIAATIGQLLAIVMGLIGLGVFGVVLGNRYNIGLVIIALFVFFGAGQEVQMEETREVVEDAPVSEAMVRDFQTLTVGDTLQRAAELLLATSQQDFPVVHGDEVAGVLSRSQLLRALAQDGNSAYVAGAMTRDVLFANTDDSLEDFMLRPDGVQRAPVLVLSDTGKLVGMLTLENVMEFLTLRQIMNGKEVR